MWTLTSDNGVVVTRFVFFHVARCLPFASSKQSRPPLVDLGAGGSLWSKGSIKWKPKRHITPSKRSHLFSILFRVNFWFLDDSELPLMQKLHAPQQAPSEFIQGLWHRLRLNNLHLIFLAFFGAFFEEKKQLSNTMWSLRWNLQGFVLCDVTHVTWEDCNSSPPLSCWANFPNQRAWWKGCRRRCRTWPHHSAARIKQKSKNVN